SGSSRADNAVEPTMSQNITVSWRRSAVSTAGGAEVAGLLIAAASPRGFPQPPQKRVVGSFSKPQAGHGNRSGAPHSAQKRLAVAFSTMQLGQRIWCPPGARSEPV